MGFSIFVFPLLEHSEDLSAVAVRWKGAWKTTLFRSIWEIHPD